MALLKSCASAPALSALMNSDGSLAAAEFRRTLDRFAADDTLAGLLLRFDPAAFPSTPASSSAAESLDVMTMTN